MPTPSHWATTILGALLVVAYQPKSFAAPQGAHQALSIRAYLKPTVHLNQESLDFHLQVPNSECGEFSFPLDIAWNLERFSSELQLIGSFLHAGSGLVGPQGQLIPASALEARVGDSSWKSFPTRGDQLAGSGLLLTTIYLSDSGRQSRLHAQLQLRVCNSGEGFAPGDYQGRVDLRTIVH